MTIYLVRPYGLVPVDVDNDLDKSYSEIKRHGGARIDQIFGDWSPQEQLPVVGDEEC